MLIGTWLCVAACGSPRPDPQLSGFIPSPDLGDDDAGDGDDDDIGDATDTWTSATDTASELAANGEDCGQNEECESGICAGVLAGQVCSECAADEHCPVDGQSCVFESSLGYRVCSAGQLGDLCQGDAGCEAGVCWRRPEAEFGLCSECRSASHCRDLGTGINCTMDLTAGWYRCSPGKLGEECQEQSDCLSALCRPEGPEAGYGKCSECTTDAQCQTSGQGLNCTNKIPEDLDDPTYFLCGDGQLGEMCEADTSCTGERCMQEHCSECQTPQQCRDEGQGRNCIYRTLQRHTGWHQCTPGDEGEPCTEAASCRPDLFCAPRFVDSTCAMCALDEHCESGEVCSVGYPHDTRVCVVANSLPSDTYCDPDGAGDRACTGFCVTLPASDESDPDAWPVEGVGVCGTCRPGASDCPTGQTCQTPTYSDALGATGSFCAAG